MASPERKRRALRPDFVRPAGPANLPWAWRLADSLSSPKAETERHAKANEANEAMHWAPVFKGCRELPESLLSKSTLPFAWRLPF